MRLPTKGKGLEHTLQKGQPSAATAQRWEPVKSRSILSSRAAEAQVLLQTVGLICEHKMTLHQELSSSELSWCKEHQALVGPQPYPHKVLSYTEQRRVMQGTACDQQATPSGHTVFTRPETARGPSQPGSPYCQQFVSMCGEGQFPQAAPATL